MFRSLISGDDLLTLWLVGFLGLGLVAGIATGFFKARKIQPRGFNWRIFRHEMFFAVITVAFGAMVLGPLNAYLRTAGYITISSDPAAWWVIALEFGLSFFLFDTYFYWLHRWMHKEPVYRLVHKLHHKSTSPNMLTTLSVHPLESLINGGFMPLFLTIFTVHDASLAIIAPTNILMGVYVHSGYEFFPRWWHRNWATKWFITATFHDQHHHYFNWNFGGYTTIWDYLCGTVRPKFHHDFENPKARRISEKAASEDAGSPEPA